MKKTILISILIIFLGVQINAQERSGILNAKEQSVGIAMGLDYSILPISLSYKRGFDLFNYKYPFTAGVDVTIPMYSFDLNDIRVRIITDMTLFRKKNFEIRGGINPVFVNVKMETETMSSLGLDFHFFTGFTNEKWNTGVEFQYNKIFSTYIKHTEIYRDNVYGEAVDGWYKNTASNIRIGILVNRSIKKFDVYLKAGSSTTGNFKGYLFVPTIYTELGLNFNF